jgi:hypothetical protein
LFVGVSLSLSNELGRDTGRVFQKQEFQSRILQEKGYVRWVEIGILVSETRADSNVTLWIPSKVLSE